jgi:phosphosulfolactate synthase
MESWDKIISMPLPGRTTKPRNSGYTMVIDKGLGVRAIEDLMETASNWIDNIKLTFGTSAFYQENLLRKKIDIITSAGIDIMPGGTYLEVAFWQGVLDNYLNKARQLGFTAMEVSDGTISIESNERENIIKKALDMDFKVITEVGKKDAKESLPHSKMHKLIAQDIRNGAFKVIIEAREAGKGVGIYDSSGAVKENDVNEIISGVEDIDCLLWEAPIKNQQQYLILKFGANVNLGNIPPDDILALEALRQGLRGDTLKRAYLKNPNYT